MTADGMCFIIEAMGIDPDDWASLPGYISSDSVDGQRNIKNDERTSGNNLRSHADSRGTKGVQGVFILIYDSVIVSKT